MSSNIYYGTSDNSYTAGTTSSDVWYDYYIWDPGTYHDDKWEIQWKIWTSFPKKCSHCKDNIKDGNNIAEVKYKGKIIRLCKKCLEKFLIPFIVLHEL